MKKVGVVAPVVGAAAIAALLSACDGDDGFDGVRVEASFYPFAFVAQQVGGSAVRVDSLTSPGVEPHDLELRPKQVGSVQTADLVVYQRTFQAAVDDAVDLADRDAATTIDVATLVDQLPAVDSDEGDDGQDPHTWLDPHTMVALTAAVREHLSRIDPAHADQYAANARRLTDELNHLDDDLRTGLASCRRRTIVTSHAAFGYLAHRYDLTQIPVAGLEPTREPSPSQLADISRLVERRGITTVFTEELASPAIADAVAQEAGARTAALDPIEGLSDETADETYLTLMRRNLETIRKADACT